MAYISNEVMNEIRNKTDIVDVISKYVNLTKKGKNYFGVCPFHDDHSPSMSVSPEKQIYTCFSCGASGNVFTFVADFEKISFTEAVRLLGEKVGINIGTNISVSNKKDEYFDIYSTANKFYQNSLFTNLGKNAIEYLDKRHIDKDTIKKFGIGLSIQKVSLTEYLINKKYSIDKLVDVGLTNENGHDIFINRIMFPIYDLSGNPVAFSGRIYNTKDTAKYVNTKETDKFKKGKILYNYHIAKEYLKKNDSVIIMEGQMDVIRASTVGIDNCIATMGTALTREHKSIIRNMANNVILCFDGDAAGEKATISAIELLEDTGVNIKIVRLPDNLDPDEYILKNGKDSFLAQINNASNLIDYKMEILKKNKDFGNIKDISSYVNSALKELINEKDNIIVELNLKKLSDNFNIDYETIKDKYNKPGNVYLGLVHRLDRMTGGVMVFAKTSKAARRLNEQIVKKDFSKKYYAIVDGILEKGDILKNYLIKDENEVKSYIGNSKNGKLAILEYSVIKILNNKTLLDINLITGRHHQIRVQFSHRQHPLVGDVLYGGSHYNQLMLYAYEISFYHPITNNRLIFNKIPTSELWDQFLK